MTKLGILTPLCLCTLRTEGHSLCHECKEPFQPGNCLFFCTWFISPFFRKTTGYFVCLLLSTKKTKVRLYSVTFKGRLSYHLCVECFSQLSFDSEVYTKSAAVADFVYSSESNESCENIRHKDDRMNSL